MAGEVVAWRYRDETLFGDGEWRYLDLRPLNTYAEVDGLVLHSDYAALERERDEAVAEAERLRGCLTQANANHEEFERKWYLVCDDRDRLREALEVSERVLAVIVEATGRADAKQALEEARAALAGRGS